MCGSPFNSPLDLIIKEIVPPAPPFSINRNECSGNLKPNRQCEIIISFSPAINFQINEGESNIVQEQTYISKLQLSTNDKDLSISLSGKGRYEPTVVKRYERPSNPRDNSRSDNDTSPKSFEPPSDSLRSDGSGSSAPKPKAGSWDKSKGSVTYEDN